MQNTHRRSFLGLAALQVVLLFFVCACPQGTDAEATSANSSETARESMPSTDGGPAGGLPQAQITEWIFDGLADLPEVPEPSGLCYHPGRNSLFIVDDGSFDRPASIYELSLETEVLQQQTLGVDLEGVCYCSADGMLYVCDESSEQLYQVAPEGLRLQATYQVSRYLDGQEKLLADGNGFEGIAYLPAAAGGPSDCFILLNQDDPHALVRIDRADVDAAAERGEIPLKAFWPLPELNAGELSYDPVKGELWVIHSWMNVLEVLDPATMACKRWEVIPGAAQEAVCLDGQGRLWIGSDLGSLSRYLPAGQAPAAAEPQQPQPQPSGG